MEIDTNLYSRQIGTFGMETMGKLIQMQVLVYGLRGVNIKINNSSVAKSLKTSASQDQRE
jgi:ubiquitin-activating enzyme E1